jgi:hypothetical protein
MTLEMSGNVMSKESTVYTHTLYTTLREALRMFDICTWMDQSPT